MKTKSENRKAMPKFILTIVIALVVGGLIGVGIVFAEGDWTTAFASGIINGLTIAAPWLLFGMTLIHVLAIVILYRKAKAQLADMTDPDDEETLDQIEALLNTALLINTTCTILSYFCISIAFWRMEQMSAAAFLLSLAGFVCAMIAMIVGQQKVVDLTKKLYPEKRGSVYDMKFAEKWYDSCDEAERAQICQSAFASYKATSMTCVILWLVLVLASMLFDIGLMSVAVVTIIWLVSSLSYSLKAIQLGKHK